MSVQIAVLWIDQICILKRHADDRCRSAVTIKIRRRHGETKSGKGLWRRAGQSLKQGSARAVVNESFSRVAPTTKIPIRHTH